MAQVALIRAGAAAVVLAAVAAEVAAPAGATALAVLDALVAVAFALGGVVAARSSRLVGWLALAVAAAWVAGTLSALGGLSAYAASVAVLLHRAPLALLLLAYPGRPLPRVLAVAAVLAPFAPAGRAPSATAAVACLVAVALVARTARSAPALRAPVAAAALAAVAIAVTAVLAAVGVGLLVAYDLVLLATAVGLLVPLSSWQAAAASGLVVELGSTPAGAPVTAQLARVLHDPGLELRLCLPGGRWTDEGGRATREPAAVPLRAVTRRALDDGTELALIHDPAAVPDRAVAEAAIAAAATAIDNARRDREVRARIEELRRLRRGLLEAADEERRQLEAELRSGPLRDVEALGRLLHDVAADQIRGELALAHQELIDIARGLYPQVLIEHGLDGALADLAARAPVPLTVTSTLGDAPLPAPLVLTAYYVANEACANVAKHARATHARIEVSTRAGELVVRIVDDGVGDADPRGAGLSGLRDRIQALDGRLRVHSPHDAGTTVEARLPM